MEKLLHQPLWEEGTHLTLSHRPGYIASAASLNRARHSNSNWDHPSLCGVTSPERKLAKPWANTHRPKRTENIDEGKNEKHEDLYQRAFGPGQPFCRLSQPLSAGPEV
jgi:hypothetical protein